MENCMVIREMFCSHICNPDFKDAIYSFVRNFSSAQRIFLFSVPTVVFHEC